MELGLLISDSDLKRELKLEGPQVSKLMMRSKEIRRRHMMRRLNLPGEQAVALVSSESTQAMAEVLSAEQLARLREIHIQIDGVVAFTTKPVEDVLALDEKQKLRVRKLVDELRVAIERIRQEADAELRKLRDSDDRAALRDKLRAMQQDLDEQWMRSFRNAHASLSEEQKARWNNLTGKTFEGTNRLAWRQMAIAQPGLAGR